MGNNRQNLISYLAVQERRRATLEDALTLAMQQLLMQNTVNGNNKTECRVHEDVSKYCSDEVHEFSDFSDF